MKTTLRCIAGLVASVTVAASCWAAGATKAEAVAQVNAAIAHIKKVGAEQGIKDVNSGAEWKTNGMNVVVNEFKGLVLASSLNDKLIGKNTLEIKDPSGKEFVKEFSATAQKGEGWVDYQFINPTTKKLEDRSMFVKKAVGVDGYVGVAISKQ